MSTAEATAPPLGVGGESGARNPIPAPLSAVRRVRWASPFPIPPFARRYRTRPAGLTPRIAYYLWFVIDTFIDDWTSACKPGSVSRDNLLADLPRIARIHADDGFIKQLVDAAKQLRYRLAAADFSVHLVARCTAHEFIIHTALDQIIDTLPDAPEVLLFAGIDSVMPVSANDSDVDRFRERLLEDADLEMLFHPELPLKHSYVHLSAIDNYAALCLPPRFNVSIIWVPRNAGKPSSWFIAGD